MGEIILIRHGQASFLAADYDDLSPLGIEQARRLGSWWRDEGRQPHRIVAGGMRRHRQTAEACLEGLGRAAGGSGVTIDPDLNEFDHEDIVAVYRPDLANHAAIARFVESSPDPARAFQEIFRQSVARWTSGTFDAEYREPWPTFRDRCEAGFARVVRSVEQGTSVAVFTSGGPISVALHKLLGMAEEDLFDRALLHANTGHTVVRVWETGTLTPGAINEIPHLTEATMTLR